MTAAVMLSRPVPIDPAAVTKHVADRAAQITADEALARIRSDDRSAFYAVNGATGDYRVRLEIDERVWSGACEHYAALGIGQARNARACSHVVAAAAAEMTARGLERLPDPNRPAPAEAPTDPAGHAAWRAQRAQEMEGFYD